MLPNPRKITFKFKRPEANGFPDSSFLAESGATKTQELLEISASSSSSGHDSGDENGGQSSGENDLSKQIVLYDPEGSRGAIVPVPGPIPAEHHQRPRHLGFSFLHQQPSRPLPSVGAFTVQCANCFKWRLIPTKEKYEEIREHILEEPFYCETAREWRPDITCDDPADIDQDGSRLWAIDKPNIAQAPNGWQRLLRIRGEGSTKFADVYYVAPSGKRLRSMVEIEKYLLNHPEYRTEGLTMSQFSFRTPKPLQPNYVRKRARPILPCDGNNPDFVRPLAWAGPDESTDLRLGLAPTLSDEPPPKRPEITPPSTVIDPGFITEAEIGGLGHS